MHMKCTQKSSQIQVIGCFSTKGGPPGGPPEFCLRSAGAMRKPSLATHHCRRNTSAPPDARTRACSPHQSNMTSIQALECLQQSTTHPRCMLWSRGNTPTPPLSSAECLKESENNSKSSAVRITVKHGYLRKFRCVCGKVLAMGPVAPRVRKA